MPNDNTASTVWKQFRTTVDDIETQTGYDILSSVPTGIQTIIESRVDTL
jgi:endonuclease G